MVIEIISKVSRGTKMDQIYLPKNRQGLEAGSYVVVKILQQEDARAREENNAKPFFYGLKYLEPIKIQIIQEIMNIIGRESYENIIITGSFLESGFNFKDIDVLVIGETKIDEKKVSSEVKSKIGADIHLIALSSKELILGLSSDPIYENMLSKCVSAKRIVFNVKRRINPQILDLQLLKSKMILDNFDALGGDEKYYLVKNLIAIELFINGKKINNEAIDKKIGADLGICSDKIKDNLLEKSVFLKKFKEAYNKTLKQIFEEAKRQNGSK